MSQQPCEQEKQDLAKLQSDLNHEARSSMDAVRHVLRITSEDELKTRGYKSTPEAVVGTVKFYLDRMDKLTKTHLRRYPD